MAYFIFTISNRRARFFQYRHRGAGAINAYHLILGAVRDENIFTDKRFGFHNRLHLVRNKPGKHAHLADSLGIQRSQCVDHCPALAEPNDIKLTRIQLNGSGVRVNKLE